MRALRPASALLLSLILVVGVARPAAADELLARVNAVRSSNVTLLSAADSVAQRSADAQAAAGSLSHANLNSLLGTCDAVGEVVGLGPTIDAIFDAFRGSPTHWNIITAPNWTSAGTGVAVGSDGLVYVSIVFCQEAGTPTVTSTTASTSTTRPAQKATAQTKPSPRRSIPQLAEPLLLTPCAIDPDLVLHEPPWETGSCPGIA